MIATADRQGIADKAARLTRAELEGLFLGVVSGLLDDKDRRQVERILERRESEQRGRKS